MSITRFVAFGDNHGDMVDKDSMDALLTFIKDFKPTVRIHLGDNIDFRAIRKGASNKEADESVKADLQAGCDFLLATRPTVWHFGNHENRIHEVIHNSHDQNKVDQYQDYLDDMKRAARQAGCKVILPYHYEKGIYRLGPVTTFHGMKAGLRATEEQGNHFVQAGGVFIHGHTHNLASATLTKYLSGMAFSAGCLCDIKKMSYAHGRLATSRWANGFVAGFVSGDKCKVFQIHKLGDKWVWPTDFRFN